MTIPQGTPGGTYFLLAVADVDDVVTELNESNNLALRALTVTGPDLIIQSLTLPKTAVKPGARATITDIAANVGSAAPSSFTRYFLGTTATVGANDPMIGTRSVAALAAGAQNSGSASITIPVSTPPGTYFVIARADGPNAVDEADETNNALARPLEVGMDLIVSALSSPAWASAGSPIDVSDVTKNQGSGTATPSTTAFFLSLTATLTSDAVLIGSRQVPALANGAISSAITPVPLPSGVAGDFYIIAVANVGAGMSGDSNNVRSKAIRVGPDLVVSGLNAPLHSRPRRARSSR